MKEKQALDISNLSQEEIKSRAAKLLGAVSNPEKGLGKELFEAVAKLTVGVAVEAVCIRLNPKTKGIEVYLNQRAPDDTAYPNQWHCLGSIMRPKEEIEDVFLRLINDEFKGNILSKKFITNVNNIHETRGHFISMVYLCALEETKKSTGKWFPMDKLPEKTVDCHRKEIIPAAVQAFLSTF